MTYETVRSAARATPFVPFTLSMAGGTRHRVGHPELIFVPPQASRMFVVVTGKETIAAIDALLVESLDFESGRSASNGSGPGTLQTS